MRDNRYNLIQALIQNKYKGLYKIRFKSGIGSMMERNLTRSDMLLVLHCPIDFIYFRQRDGSYKRVELNESSSEDFTKLNRIVRYIFQ